ncbi:MAG: NifU family protein [Mycobacterium sp.]
MSTTTPLDTDRVQAAVDEAIRQHLGRFLDSHGGAVAAASVSRDGDVTLAFDGACRACPAVAATFYSKVAPLIRQVDGVRSVSAPNVHVADVAVERILSISLPTGRPGLRTSPTANPAGEPRTPIQVNTGPVRRRSPRIGAGS